MVLRGGDKAGSMIDRLNIAVEAAMQKAEQTIGSATDVLVDEINQGAKAVRTAILKDATMVRQRFGEVIGNAAAMAEGAVDEAEKALGATKEPEKKTPASEVLQGGAAPSTGESPRPNGSGGAA